jgi:hypothetical protein
MQVAGASGSMQRKGVDVNYWKARFLDVYKRALSTVVASAKAQIILSRKALVGLKPDEQSKVATNGVPSHGLYSGFRDHFHGPTKGTHYYDITNNQSSSSDSSSSSSSSDDG